MTNHSHTLLKYEGIVILVKVEISEDHLENCWSVNTFIRHAFS